MGAKTLFFLGAIAFWLPEILLYGIERHEPGVRLITLLLPCTLLVAYVAAVLIRRDRESMPSAAIFMLLGVWFLGTLAISIGQSFLGGGFSRDPHSTLLGVLLGTLVPIYAFIAATYDGSLGALIAVSVLMPLLHVLFERTNWIVPRRKAS